MLEKRNSNIRARSNLELLEERWLEEPALELAKRQYTPAPSTGCSLYVIYGSVVLLNVSLPTNQTHFQTSNVTYQANTTLTYREVCAANSTPVAVTVGNIVQTVTIPPQLPASSSSTRSLISVSGTASATVIVSSGSTLTGQGGATCKQDQRTIKLI
jgi:hypothetical protein